MAYRVYYLKNEEDKIVYVGITSRDPKARMYDHKKDYPHRKNYKMTVLEETEDKKTAEDLETFYIKLFDTVNNGENITYGVGRRGLGATPTGFKSGNAFGKMGTKSVVCVDTNVVYKSLTACSKATGVSITKISECCRGKRKSSHGLHFKYCTD